MMSIRWHLCAFSLWQMNNWSKNQSVCLSVCTVNCTKALSHLRYVFCGHFQSIQAVFLPPTLTLHPFLLLSKQQLGEIKMLCSPIINKYVQICRRYHYMPSCGCWPKTALHILAQTFWNLYSPIQGLFGRLRRFNLHTFSRVDCSENTWCCA